MEQNTKIYVRRRWWCEQRQWRRTTQKTLRHWTSAWYTSESDTPVAVIMSKTSNSRILFARLSVHIFATDIRRASQSIYTFIGGNGRGACTNCSSGWVRPRLLPDCHIGLFYRYICVSVLCARRCRQIQLDKRRAEGLHNMRFHKLWFSCMCEIMSNGPNILWVWLFERFRLWCKIVLLSIKTTKEVLDLRKAFNTPLKETKSVYNRNDFLRLF